MDPSRSPQSEIPRAVSKQSQGSLLRRVLVLAVALALVGAFAGHSSSRTHTDPTQLTLWAWERPEDLRFLADSPALQHLGTSAQDCSTAAPQHCSTVRVAFLDRTVSFDDGRMAVRYRQQPLLVSPDTPLMSVVRVETRGRAPGILQADATAALVVKAVHAPRVTALQIDFDARKSDRTFYAAVLKSVRGRLPRDIPLSITSLASWCVDDSVDRPARRGRDRPDGVSDGPRRAACPDAPRRRRPLAGRRMQRRGGARHRRAPR